MAPRPILPAMSPGESREGPAGGVGRTSRGHSPVDASEVKESKPKRTRKRFSCAECRRLKIKCSQTWPCEACVKGGCAQICPDGQLWKSQGRRLFVGDSEDLRDRISSIQNGSPSTPTIRKPPPVRLNSSDTVVGSTLGTLTTGHGASRYVGKLAGSEYLHQVEEDDEDITTIGSKRQKLNTDFDPTLSPVLNSVDLRRHLPDWNREGRILVDIYWQNVDWIQQAMPRTTFNGDYLINAYDVASSPDPHKIACVFLVMALGAMYDLNKEPYQKRAGELYRYSRMCMRHDHGSTASVATVQAILLSGTYILNDSHPDGAEKFWPMIGNAIKIAQSIGLHRDGTDFGLSYADTQLRRQVWWELITYDRLQALCFGRPCATSNRHADTHFPEEDEAMMADKVGYHASKHRLASILEHVIDLQNQLAPLEYSSILDLNARLEAFKRELPDDLLSTLDIEDLPLSLSVESHKVLQRFGIRLLISQTRLHLHRLPFSRALGMSPLAPDTSSFGQSFIALFQSAQEIVHLVKQLVLYHPGLIARLWAFWFHAYTSAVCLAAVVIQAPKSKFAPTALEGMSIVCDLAAAAREGCRAKKGLKTLLKLRQRARDALDGIAPQINPETMIDSPEGLLGLTKREGGASAMTTPSTMYTPDTSARTAELSNGAARVDGQGVQPGAVFWDFKDDLAIAPDDLGFNIDDFLNEIQENKLEIVV